MTSVGNLELYTHASMQKQRNENYVTTILWVEIIQRYWVLKSHILEKPGRLIANKLVPSLNIFNEWVHLICVYFLYPLCIMTAFGICH